MWCACWWGQFSGACPSDTPTLKIEVARGSDDDRMYPQQPPQVIYVERPSSGAARFGGWVVISLAGTFAAIFLCCGAGLLAVAIRDSPERRPAVTRPTSSIVPQQSAPGPSGQPGR